VSSSSKSFAAEDWEALRRLRAAFLDGTAGDHDYWRTERDLERYDATFGQRIRWKWDYVLRELKQRGWSPPAGNVLDWGCGSGVAGEAFGATHVWDRSRLAMDFASRKLGAKIGIPDEIGTLLVSHVLTESSEALAVAGRATAVIWVEPGTYNASRKLIALRERLREQFHVVAPCTHQAACGMLTAENDRHWCHHFAPSPPEVFRDGDWARFAKLAGIDLRSLPVSYLVLDKRPVALSGVQEIGRARVYKAHALVLSCDASGVRERRVTKRDEPEEFRRLKKAGK